MKQMEKVKILVIYIGIAGFRSEDVPEYVAKVGKKISPETLDSEIIIIPTQSYETRIECINPIYITDEELKIKHTNLMQELHEELETQIKVLKDGEEN
jgi:hypothetical protein